MKTRILWIMGLVALLLLPAPALWARPTTAEEARLVVNNWRSLEARPLGASLGERAKEVQTFSDATGSPLYYVVYLEPAGLVIVPGDDLVEPIIGFLPEATSYDPSLANPLGALVSRDLPGRVLTARNMEKQAKAQGREFLPKGREKAAQRKWDRLKSSSAAQPQAQESGLPSVTDVRVTPLVKSTWDQGTVSTQACYNYYTPPYGAGNPNNYVCGCVATAMAQLMRFWQHPTSGVGTAFFAISVNGVPLIDHLHGGDLAGGPYDWANMVLQPLNNLTTLQCQAIGNLTHDAGISVHTDYGSEESAAYFRVVADALRNNFMYSNAIYGAASYYVKADIPTVLRDVMVNPNLDAGFPVLFGIRTPGFWFPEGHAIVCDGYGFDGSTEYHHLNMGWSGQDDAWYNLPTIDISDYNFNTVDECVYNVYVTGSGEIISGRVLDASGNPISGATVTATRYGGGTYTATTNAKGIYALAKVPSASAYSIAANKPGYPFTNQLVSTSTSLNGLYDTGNLWGIDFVAGDLLSYALDNSSLAFTTTGATPWYPESATFYYGGFAAQSGQISDNQSSTLQTTVVGPGAISFYWKVSSEALGDFLEFYVDDVLNDEISGEVDWHLKTYAIPAGSHIVKWVFSKDASNSAGSDCGWVDKVVFTHTPALSVNPASLRTICMQGTNAPSQTFTVHNDDAGGATMSYSIIKDAAWLSVTPTSGTSSREVDTITVTYTTSGLAAGQYNGTITVTADEATGSPKTIGVTLRVTAPRVIATGSVDTLAILADGSLWAWGDNSQGQLGLGPLYLNSTTPTRVETATDWVAIVAGLYYSLGLKADGSLWAWGDNIYGQLGLGDSADRDVPTKVGIATDWMAIAAGAYHSLALKTDGSLWAWGGNSYFDFMTTPTRVGADTDWVAIAAGAYHSLALKADGSLWAWGDNSQGQLGLGTNLNSTTPTRVGTATDWVAIAAGDYHSLALKADGSLWAWGWNSNGQLGVDYLYTSYWASPIVVGYDTDWVAVAAGQRDSLALKADGSLWAWGWNSYGQLGLGNNLDSTTPTRVGPDTDWVAVAAGDYHSLGLKADHSLWAWGNNSYGQLGGRYEYQNVPTQVTSWGSPVGCSVVINGRASVTDNVNVTLTLAATGATQMQFNNDGGAWSAWEAYATTKNWVLPSGDGIKTVNVQFRDRYSWYSNLATVSSTIILDQTAPTGSMVINNGDAYTKTTAVMLMVMAADGTGSGLAQMQFSNDSSTWSALETYAATKVWTLPSGDGTKTVYARFTDNAGKVSAAVSATIILDTLPPTGCTVAVNGGAAFTNNASVTLTLAATGAATMSFSNDQVTWTTPETYATSKAWNLASGDGNKTVYAWFADPAGNLAAASGTITLDATAPTGSIAINSGAAYTKTAAVTLNLSASDTGSGLDKMAFSNDNATWSTPEAYAATKSYTLTSGDGTKTVYARFTDKAGNVSTAVSDTIVLDAVAPTGSIAIQGGAAYTKTAAVTLNLSATDTGSGLDKMAFSNDGNTWSTPEAYAATKAWTLASGDGTKTVYARFTDKAGNVSAAVSDSIVLDTTPPTGTIAIQGGAAYTRITAVVLNLTSAGGATQMCFSANQTSWSSWENVATTKQYNLAAPDGLKWVYVKYRDAAGNESAPAGASITLDTTPPKDGTLKATPGNKQITLTWSGFSDATSGLSTYRLFYGTTGVPTAATGTKIYEGAALTFTHKNLTNGKPCYYRLCAVDKAGNVSTGATAAATPKAGGALPFLELLLGD